MCSHTYLFTLTIILVRVYTYTSALYAFTLTYHSQILLTSRTVTNMNFLSPFKWVLIHCAKALPTPSYQVVFISQIRVSIIWNFLSRFKWFSLIVLKLYLPHHIRWYLTTLGNGRCGLTWSGEIGSCVMDFVEYHNNYIGWKESWFDHSRKYGDIVPI